MIPILTRVVVELPFLFVGSILLERFFGIPGLGAITVESVVANDVPVVRAMTFIFAVLLILANLLTDVAYTMVDPRCGSRERLRRQGRGEGASRSGSDAYRRLRAEKLAVACFVVVVRRTRVVGLLARRASRQLDAPQRRWPATARSRSPDAALFASYDAPHNELTNSPPSWQHLFGTDAARARTCSRASRTDAASPWASESSSLRSRSLIGGMLGAAAGWFGGVVDDLISARSSANPPP